MDARQVLPGFENGLFEFYLKRMHVSIEYFMIWQIATMVI